MGPDFRVLVRKSRKQAEQYHRLYKVLMAVNDAQLFNLVLYPAEKIISDQIMFVSFSFGLLVKVDLTEHLPLYIFFSNFLIQK